MLKHSDVFILASQPFWFRRSRDPNIGIVTRHFRFWTQWGDFKAILQNNIEINNDSWPNEVVDMKDEYLQTIRLIVRNF